VKITKISQQVKRKDRYSIYVDEKYSFSLGEYQLASSGLRSGKELTQIELDDFIGEAEFGRAYERSLNYVMIRPRSEKEIQDYLVRTFLYPKPKSYLDKNGKMHIVKKEVDKEATNHMIERVVDRLNDKGYINDESFTKAWVQSRMFHKKPSKRKLEQELYKKGIKSEIIATVLQNEELNEKDNLLELVKKKRKIVRYQDDQKLIPYLLRQGFNYEDIKDAIKR
jgi:regulatory protein